MCLENASANDGILLLEHPKPAEDGLAVLHPIIPETAQCKMSIELRTRAIGKT